jgi:putative acetyltransferase
VNLNPTIRPEEPGDVDAIRSLNDAAFGGPTEGRIVDEVRGTDRWVEGGSLVAVDASGRLVGHLLLSEGDLVADSGTRRIWMLGPVAVAPNAQRRGVGAALMRAAIDLAVSRSQPVICLVGHADYYPRFGFEPARRLGIEPPRPWSDDHWLALRLPAWDPSLRGVARFAPAFPTD